MAAVKNSGTPTGTVSFCDGTQLLGSGTLANGVASLAVSFFPEGSDKITADYSGDANFNPNISQPQRQVVKP